VGKAEKVKSKLNCRKAGISGPMKRETQKPFGTYPEVVGNEKSILEASQVNESNGRTDGMETLRGNSEKSHVKPGRSGRNDLVMGTHLETDIKTKRGSKAKIGRKQARD